MAPSAAEEAAFMASILLGLDNSLSTTAGECAPPRTPTKPVKQPERDGDLDTISFLEGSENWDLDDLSFSPIKPSSTIVKKAPSLSPQAPYIPDPSTRCVVEAVSEEYINSKWRKSIVARTDKEKERIIVYLYDDWYQTDIRVDDIFNVIGALAPVETPSTLRSISLTSQSNLLILHPDILLTATALSNAPQCRRRPLLSSLVRSTSDVTPSLIWGSMLHEIMQRCLLEDKWDDAFMQKCINDTVSAGLADLVKVGVEEEIAKREITDRASGLKIFQEKYLGDLPKDGAKLVNTRSKAFEEPSLLAINGVLDIEEDIWSPTYGLKGKIDATVQGIISEPTTTSSTNYTTRPSTERRLMQVPLPFELKTGRALAGMEHRAQTMLYTLLLSERYGADIQDGLLFYTQSEEGEVVRVPRGRNEIRGLVGVRNEIAAYMWRRVREKKKGGPRPKNAMDVDGENGIVHKEVDIEESFLPPPIDDERICKRCYVQDTCFLFRKTHPNHFAAEQGQKNVKFDPPIPTFLSGVFEAKTSHLTPSQTEFFRDWERLLALEEKDLVRFRKELWTLGAEEREKKGRCFAGMVIINSERPKKVLKGMNDNFADMEEEIGLGNNKDGKIHRYTYTFARSTKWTTSSSSASKSGIPAQSLLSGHLNVGDPITVSAEPLLALARGFILELTPSEVVLGVDHALDIESIRAKLRTTSSAPKVADVVFRIDKDELFGGMARIRSNLAQLFYVDGDRRRLELVVDLRRPIFAQPDPPFVPDTLFLPTTRVKQQNLNSCQLAAIEKALSAEDYALILGMPGTGKTTVIAALIRELVGRGKTILLTSYTHSAVDTILMKLTENNNRGTTTTANDAADFGILRLGNLDKVHPEMRKYTLNAKGKIGTVKEYEMRIMSPPVVATTCLSVDHPLFSRRTFDYCIVDEASQITLPTCLGPLRFAHKFVLVGDHHQLPPVVKNPEARKGGLDVSLFRRLSGAHPEAVVDLRLQYRMNSDIMLLSNRLIYDNRLSCGCEEVAKRSLSLPTRQFLEDLHSGGSKPRGCGGGSASCWLETLANDSCKAVFVDTDSLPAPDSRVGDLVQNLTEADLVYQLTETLIRCGVQESQIGIISLYRQQVKLLQHLLRERRDVEILTADRSQGRDKDCIIISLVRSNPDGFIGDLVKDWRRMNVSFTRARGKLVLFGSRKTLQREPLLAQFFGLMEKQNWILPLPTDSGAVHAKAFQGSSSVRPVVEEGEDRSTTTTTTVDVVGQKRRLGGKENVVHKGASENDKHVEEVLVLPAAKKMKVTKVNVDRGGLLKGRPVLSDLVVHGTS